MTLRILLPVLLVVMAGCSPPTGQPTSSPPADSPASGSPQPTSAPTGEPTQEPNEQDPAPPPAELVLPDGSVKVGTLGSYAFDGAAADSPWLPARVLPEVEVEAGARLDLRLAEAMRFVSWGARYADAQDEAAEVISPLASGGDGSSPLAGATFAGPPSGSWVLVVQLYFADDLGDAAYYWHLVVP